MTARSSDEDALAVTDLLAATLRGDPAAAAVLSAIDPDEVCRAAGAHGVLPLLAERLLPCADPGDPLAERLQIAARRAVVDDVVQQRELCRALDALHAAGIRAVLMKGAQLAYSYYARPDARPRVDTDLFVAESDGGQVAAALGPLGYAAVPQSAGDLLSYQTSYALVRDGATVHLIDVHRRIANPQRFRAALSFEEADRAAVPVPALGPHARGLAPVQALLLACVHPIAHHGNAHCLIWQFDIHLVASRFTDGEWQAFAALARHRGLAGVCRKSLELSVRDFGTLVPDALWRDLVSESSDDAATSAYLTEGRRHIERVWWDLRALPGWRARTRLMRQHLFPPAQYMREVYAPASAAPLPWLYARRVWHGAHKWLARS
ncbi:MAG TPA: nucleotidyltransferase family protein [Vicinamibacterales bacterium]|nr:nucleotidyltransferase family protein [Vicinamibacterales bacterium]